MNTLQKRIQQFILNTNRARRLRNLRQFGSGNGRGQGIVLYAIMVGIVVVGVFLMVSIVSTAHKNAEPTVFQGDILTIVENCAGSNVSSFGQIVGTMVISSESVNADGLLQCLYAAGVTLVQNGDPVLMRTVTP